MVRLWVKVRVGSEVLDRVMREGEQHAGRLSKHTAERLARVYEQQQLADVEAGRNA